MATLNCWRYDCKNRIERLEPVQGSGDYAAEGGVIHVGWHNGRLLTTASCTEHMTTQAQQEWDSYAAKYGEVASTLHYGPRPVFKE